MRFSQTRPKRSSNGSFRCLHPMSSALRESGCAAKCSSKDPGDNLLLILTFALRGPLWVQAARAWASSDAGYAFRLQTAAKCWLSYTQTIEFIEPVFDEFDPLHTGGIKEETLGLVLSRLNDDVGKHSNTHMHTCTHAHVNIHELHSHFFAEMISGKRCMWQADGCGVCQSALSR